MPYHVMLVNYEAKNEREISVSIDDEIEVLDDGNTDYWLVDNLSTEQEGLVPSYLIQEVSEEQYKRFQKDGIKKTNEQRT